MKKRVRNKNRFRCDEFELKPVRKPTKKVITRYGKIKKFKIAELCLYCLNKKCEGYDKDYNNKKKLCHTFLAWRDGKLTLEQAVKAKCMQTERHERTDELRNVIFDVLVSQCDTKSDYEVAKSVAAEIVKGKGIKEALAGTKFRFTEEQMKEIREQMDEIRKIREEEKKITRDIAEKEDERYFLEFEREWRRREGIVEKIFKWIMPITYEVLKRIAWKKYLILRKGSKNSGNKQ